jgi:hypothetical protein
VEVRQRADRSCVCVGASEFGRFCGAMRVQVKKGLLEERLRPVWRLEFFLLFRPGFMRPAREARTSRPCHRSFFLDRKTQL